MTKGGQLLSNVSSCSVDGIDAFVVDVEVDISNPKNS